MQVRCPDCDDPIELADDASLSDVSCPCCGSRFALIDSVHERVKTVVADPPPPRRIAHFELLKILGRGAFGTVWMARDTQLDRTVAVKIPRKEQLDAAQSEQFLREARTAAQLRHPSIVSVHEVGRDGDSLYIVSDLIEGVSLADRFTDRPMGAREAAGLCAKVADALHYAHEAGVIHRDLKPANIMLDAEGEPHLMDFGVAKREASEITATVQGKIFGTPAYMSPEQAKGEGHQADGRTDVYSLGVILFQMLTCELPFRGNQRMLLHHVIHDEPPSPRRLDSRVPRDLETICLKCLEKDPRRRYPTAQAVAEEFRRFLNGAPIRARRVSQGEKLWRWCRRKPVVAGLCATAVSLLFAVAVVSTNAYYLEEELREVAVWERDEAQEARRAEARARRAAQEKALETRRYLYVAHMRLAQQVWESADVGAVLELLNRHRSGPEQEDLRGFEWYYLWRLCHSETLTLEHAGGVFSVAFSPGSKMLVSGGFGQMKLWDLATGEERLTLEGHADWVGCAAFSPDGKTLASGSPDETVRLWDLAAGTLRTTLEHGGWVWSLAFSPDGRTLASGGRDGTVKLWDVAIGESTSAVEGHTGPVFSVAFSPDGDTLTSVSQKAVRLWDVATGVARAASGEDTTPVFCVGLSPDGAALASASPDGTVRVRDVTTGEERATLRGRDGRVQHVVFAADGKTLASRGGERKVKLWDAATGEALTTLTGHSRQVESMAFSPDGRTLASAGLDETVRLWDVSRQWAALKRHKGSVFSVAFSYDGKTLATASHETVQLWGLAPGEGHTTLKGHTHDVLSVAFSPDGKTLASGGLDRTVKLWDLAAGQLRTTLQGHANQVSSVAFSPQGKTLASGSDETVRLWDVATGALRQTLEGHTDWVESVTFAPDGKTLASGSRDGTVGLWDAATGELQATLKAHTRQILSVAFSPNGKELASASADDTVKLWRPATGEEPITLRGHGAYVSSLAFCPDGKTLASGSDDRTVKLWDVATGEELATLKGHNGLVSSVAFSPDGRTLASASQDQTVRLWHAAAEAQVLAGGEEARDRGN